MKNREKGEKRMQKFLRRLERFSQSLLSPLSYLSAAGLLVVVGALLTLSLIHISEPTRPY